MGMVGEALGTKLVQLGHQVMMGSRSKGTTKRPAPGSSQQEPWLAAVLHGAEAAEFGELVLNCTAGGARRCPHWSRAGEGNLPGRSVGSGEPA